LQCLTDFEFGEGFTGAIAFAAITFESYAIPEAARPEWLLVATLLVTAFYLVLNFVFLYGPSPEAISGLADVATIASSAVGGELLSFVVRLIVCIALLSSISSMIVAGPRVYAKMADDGVFPSWLKPVQQGNLKVPFASILMQVVLACLVVAFSSITDLLDYLGFTISVTAALTVACIFWSCCGAKESSAKSLFYSIVAAVGPDPNDPYVNLYLQRSSVPAEATDDQVTLLVTEN